MSSNLVSSYIFGYLSDKIGRKKSTLIALLMVAGGVILSSFMPEYISFTIIRFITGFGMYRASKSSFFSRCFYYDTFNQ